MPYFFEFWDKLAESGLLTYTQGTVALFNHRAKRGGSLSGVGFGGRREGCVRSQGFWAKVVPYVGIFGRNLEGMDFRPSRTEWLCPFLIWSPGGRAITAKVKKIGVLAIFG